MEKAQKVFFHTNLGIKGTPNENLGSTKHCDFSRIYF